MPHQYGRTSTSPGPGAARGRHLLDADVVVASGTLLLSWVRPFGCWVAGVGTSASGAARGRRGPCPPAVRWPDARAARRRSSRGRTESSSSSARRVVARMSSAAARSSAAHVRERRGDRDLPHHQGCGCPPPAAGRAGPPGGWCRRCGPGRSRCSAGRVRRSPRSRRPRHAPPGCPDLGVGLRPSGDRPGCSPAGQPGRAEPPGKSMTVTSTSARNRRPDQHE